MVKSYYLLDKYLFNLEPYHGSKHTLSYSGKGAPEFKHNMKEELVAPYFYAGGHVKHSNNDMFVECFLQALRIVNKKISFIEDNAIAKHVCEVTFADQEPIVFGVNSVDAISQWEMLTPDSFQAYNAGESFNAGVL